ncbi:hypothetical protein INN71_02760 [Nocardioides sp. ChNu-153]|uniref:hypothetical protein n=1 Tax=Nocardioides sp. ChNu-153 TaxID=2779364 RepID=UPI0026519824|nr:hypothetical protein [Nocardioides sp. ChNu-153]MDN7120307.1 hypothetical protein [Nocardioides sp. ChNu-153]
MQQAADEREEKRGSGETLPPQARRASDGRRTHIRLMTEREKAETLAKAGGR